MQRKTEAFLLEHGMHYTAIDFNAECSAFVKQMEDGLSGKTSSLMMIPTFITVDENIAEGKEIIAVDAGGTNLRVATAAVNAGRSVSISSFKKYPMPGTDKPISIDEFFEIIADYLKPVINKSDKIGFCFSYPCEILPDKDGRIIGFNKEVRVEKAAGRIIGRGINAALKKRGINEKQFTILNDTVATMLGGMAAGKTYGYEDYIGFILGTGTNACYLENSANITKSAEAQAVKGRMGVNLESGGYDGFIQGTYDKELDNESANPGDHKLEKMISGAYHGGVIYKTIAGGIKEGLFSDRFGYSFARLDALTMQDIDGFYLEPQGDNALALLSGDNKDDREVLAEIIDASYERAAKITAVTFAAIMTRSGSGRDVSKPVCITAEGTTYKKSLQFRKKLDAYMDCFLKKGLGLNCKIITGDDIVIKGTAIAAMMNK